MFEVRGAFYGLWFELGAQEVHLKVLDLKLVEEDHITT